ncbi:carbamoyltransferase family protein [Dactylosporangium matsuzakiense]|uniref:Nodulation protein NolNO n=1 Tax=Dactylosporangium matsuzakiense TaxID=53360 RepID=A0A9W6KFN0_9ACTN|nr:carbamoyltransferase C-terminal domain-containing protein [Dactylosporangium matsuzakiense]GLK99179.1 nodulation protein NolNO [Dactylosporangium matsuzakiense]
MLILGLNFGFHDPSAALVSDGSLLALVEQERLSRRKRAPHELPLDAVTACLDAAGVRPADVDAIAWGWDVERFDPPLPPESFRDVRNALPPQFARPLPPVTRVAHHVSHAASAFWSSGFESAAFLIADGQGEREATSLGLADESGVKILASYPVNASLGHFYRAAAQFAGLERDGSRGEGKLMGLAAYGRPGEPMPLVTAEGELALASDVRVRHTADTRTEMRDALRRWWTGHAFPFVAGNTDEQMSYVHFAASAQAVLEDALINLARQAQRLTGASRLVVAGGVAQNCSANAAIVAAGDFDEYYFLPVPHDAGVSLGAALHVAHAESLRDRSGFRPARMEHAYWGPAAGTTQIDDALSGTGLRVEPLPDEELSARTARAIADGLAVCWFTGRAEIGARALGARSMLADPRKRETVLRINRLKGREVWRPLAPSVLAERFDEFFEAGLASPFMNVRAMVRSEVRHRIPAVVHIDGSARPQAVSAEHSPRYWALIKAFEDLTGVPLVLNTSFNLAGEPIVNSPADAVRTFVNGGLDVLVLENRFVTRPDPKA